MKAYLLGYLLIFMIFAPISLGLMLGAWAIPATVLIYSQIPKVFRRMRKAASRG